MLADLLLIEHFQISFYRRRILESFAMYAQCEIFPLILFLIKAFSASSYVCFSQPSFATNFILTQANYFKHF